VDYKDEFKKEFAERTGIDVASINDKDISAAGDRKKGEDSLNALKAFQDDPTSCTAGKTGTDEQRKRECKRDVLAAKLGKDDLTAADVEKLEEAAVDRETERILKACIDQGVNTTMCDTKLKIALKNTNGKDVSDVELGLKKEKAKGELTPDQRKKLELAKDAKNKAIDQTVDLTIQRMDDLATTDGLKKVVSLGKTKSKIAANKVVLKSASGEIKKTLKVKEKELEAKATKQKTALADYEATPDQVAAAKDKKTTKATDTKTDTGKTTDDGERKTTAELKKDADAAAAKGKEDKGGKKDDKKKDDDGMFGRMDYVSPNEKDPEEINYEVDIKAFNDNIEAERTELNKKEKELEQDFLIPKE
jgi:hypothetical protein